MLTSSIGYEAAEKNPTPCEVLYVKQLTATRIVEVELRGFNQGKKYPSFNGFADFLNLENFKSLKFNNNGIL